MMEIVKRDRGSTRTSQDIERKYNFGNMKQMIKDLEKVVDDSAYSFERMIMDTQKGIGELEGEFSKKISQVIQTVDGMEVRVSQNTNRLGYVQSEAVKEALEKMDKRLDSVLDDYSTTYDIETLINTRAGEIQTLLSGKIEVDLENGLKGCVTQDILDGALQDYTKNEDLEDFTTKDDLRQALVDYVKTERVDEINGLVVSLEQSVNETLTEYNRRISETYEVINKEGGLKDQILQNSTSIEQHAIDIALKLDSDKLTSSAIIGLINNRDGTSTAKIAASNVEIDGILTITDGRYATQEEVSGFVTNDDLNGYVQTGDLSDYVKNDALDDYALKNSLSGYATKLALQNGTTQIDGACITTGKIAAARLDLGNCVMTSAGVVETELKLSGGLRVNSTGTAAGIEVYGTTPFIDFHHNNSSVDYTQRIIADSNRCSVFGKQLVFLADNGIVLGAVGATDGFLHMYYNSSSSYTYFDTQAVNGIKVCGLGGNDYRPITAGKLISQAGSYYSNLYISGSATILGTPSDGGGVYIRDSATGGTDMPITAKAHSLPSSRRYKKNIEPMSEEEANKILDVAVVNFDYKNELNGTGCRGVIAEDVYELIPSVVTMQEIDGKMVPDSVDYSKFVPYLMKEMQMIKRDLEEVRKNG